MPTLKAFKVSDSDYDKCVIVYAKSASRAKVVGQRYLDIDCYFDMRATRIPAADKWAGLYEAVDDSSEHMRELGWYCHDYSSADECSVCGLYDWPDIPDSKLVEEPEGVFVCLRCWNKATTKEQAS